jgi:hypothetical protein
MNGLDKHLILCTLEDFYWEQLEKQIEHNEEHTIDNECTDTDIWIKRLNAILLLKKGIKGG